jgi:hypothetical protein
LDNAQVESFDQKYVTGLDKITKKNDFVTGKRPFSGKNFWMDKVDGRNRLWQFGFCFLP